MNINYIRIIFQILDNVINCHLNNKSVYLFNLYINMLAYNIISKINLCGYIASYIN